MASYNSDGIFLSDSDNNRIESNTTSDNDNTGITLTGAGDGSDDNRVDENSSSDNENFWIAVENSSDRNRVRRNEANNNGFLNGNSGILVDATSAGTRIEDNVANRNKFDGISVSNIRRLQSGKIARTTMVNGGLMLWHQVPTAAGIGPGVTATPGSA